MPTQKQFINAQWVSQPDIEACSLYGIFHWRDYWLQGVFPTKLQVESYKIAKVDSDDAEEKASSCSHWCYVSELLLVMIGIGGWPLDGPNGLEKEEGSGQGPAIWNCYFLQPAWY